MQWFRRLAGVPGIPYEGSSDLDRVSLSECDELPEERVYELGGQRHASLSWTTPDGVRTSASPASRYASEQANNQKHDPYSALRKLREILELPGEPSDYHFAIQNVCKAIFNFRREHPELLGEVERLCWLDINLVEALPETVQFNPGKFARVQAFELLFRLYEGEGYVEEALEIAERGLRSGQEYLTDRAQGLRAKLAELEAEEATS